MGRRKIEIKPIRDDRNRSVTFLKRKGGLFKKAHELSVLCSVDVAVVIFGHNKKLYEYSSSDINEIIGRFQYYGGAHEHKGPADFTNKDAGDDEDEDGDGGDEGDERHTPMPDHTMMHPHMQNHPGFQHVRHGTPGASPPMHNGPMPQFQRGPSPLPANLSRPSSRTSQHAGHIRRTSSNLVPPHMQQPQSQASPPQPSYAYTPNPPFYNPQGAPQMQHPAQHGPPSSYPMPYGPGQPQHMQQHPYMSDNRRPNLPPNQPPHGIAQGGTSHPPPDHLQPPNMGPSRGTPQPQRPTPSPQPAQQEFLSPPIPQPKPSSAHAKSNNIFTPIDDSRSMLAQHWGTPTDGSRNDNAIKADENGPRPQSVDVGMMQRGKEGTLKQNGAASKPPAPRGAQPSSADQRSQSSSSVPTMKGPTRSNTGLSDAKRPRLKVQIPSEQSGDEGGTGGSGMDETSASQPLTSAQQPHPQHGVVLPPPSPSAGAILSAGAQGPPNPFARPAPPMSSNPHAMPRDNDTPMTALPSRFMSDSLLPSPSAFYQDWGLSRSGDSNMLPSPLNFQTPVAPNGQGWKDDDRKRQNDDDYGGGDSKRAKT